MQRVCIAGLKLITQGRIYLNEASVGTELSSYHIEASIAYEHCAAKDFASTNWSRILQLYDWLYQIKPNPLVAVNRAIIIGELHGPEAGLAAVDDVEGIEALDQYYLLPAIRAEFLGKMGDRLKAKAFLEKALELTDSLAEKELLEEKILKLG
jgi:predicted RNA polymerase sigma factor